MFRIFAVSMILIASMITQSSAAIVTLDCKMTDLRQGGGWIPSVALIKVDTERKSVQLLKPTADQMNGRLKLSLIQSPSPRD